MRAALYVGRVGSLAVALGIGIAVLGGFGAAAVSSADSTPSKSSADESSADEPAAGRDKPTSSEASESETKPPNGTGPAKRDHPSRSRSAGDNDRPATSRSATEKRSTPDSPGADADADETAPSRPRNGQADDVTVTAVSVGTDVVTAHVDGASDSPAPGPAPEPLSKVVESTLLAYSRRDGAADENNSSKSVRPATPKTASAPALQANSVAPAAVGSAEAVAAVEIPRTPTPGYDIAPDWEAAYTGQPSFIHQILVTGVRVVNAVADALGIPFSLGSLSFGDGTPPTSLMPGTDVTKRQYVDEPSGVTWDEWIITPEEPTGERVIAFHGGGFTAEANIFQYLTYNRLALDTGATVVVPVYPVIGKGGTAATVVPVAANLIESEVLAYGADKVSVLGDSAGGSISLAALQLQAARIAQRKADPDSMPSRLVLFSPSLDSNDPYTDIPFDDPILDPEVSKQNRVSWIGGLDPTDPLTSPVYGSLDGLPPTTVYSSSLDQITFQTLRLQQKAADASDGDFTFVLRKGLIHDWMVFFFLSDAQAEYAGYYTALGVLPESV
ncbi:MAG: alpha/beta hydrolase fold domain-containing protein [Mycobacterium sp.]